MIELDLINHYKDLDEFSLVLALKLIELRIYIDISYTEEYLRVLKEDLDIITDKKDRKLKEMKVYHLSNIFLDKIKWFKKWVDERNLKLVGSGLDNIGLMDIDEILNIVSTNDSVNFKRNKIFKEVIRTPIYENNEIIENIDAMEISSEEISSILGIDPRGYLKFKKF